MVEIILARHGETDWNVGEVFRGRIDIELNETGIKQAKLLAKCLSQVKIDAVYSSPLKRALQTAELIAGYHQLKVNEALGLIDFDYGEWQGLSHHQVKDGYKELYEVWTDHPEVIKMPGGESLDDVRKRALAVVEEVVGKYQETVALVSHRVIDKVLICALLGLDNSHFWNIKQDTAAITIFSYEKGRFVLTRHNDTSYLKPIATRVLSDF